MLVAFPREIEYIECSSIDHPTTLFTHFKTNTKSIDIHRVLRFCVLMKKSKRSERHEMGQANQRPINIPSLCNKMVKCAQISFTSFCSIKNPFKVNAMWLKDSAMQCNSYWEMRACICSMVSCCVHRVKYEGQQPYLIGNWADTSLHLLLLKSYIVQYLQRNVGYKRRWSTIMGI